MICTKCGEKKELNLKNFFWRKARDGRKATFKKQCKECICNYAVEYHHKNYETKLKEQMYVRATKWRKNNRIKIGINHKKKEENDLNFKLRNRLRSRICSAIKHNTNYKNKKDITTLILLDAPNIEFIWKHLEKNFKYGMNRKNHGKWHIDHIIPCSFFDLRCPVQQIACFHYSNLQPLWAADNIRKRDQLNYENK